jgi:hypothetical protein
MVWKLCLYHAAILIVAASGFGRAKLHYRTSDTKLLETLGDTGQAMPLANVGGDGPRTDVFLVIIGGWGSITAHQQIATKRQSWGPQPVTRAPRPEIHDRCGPRYANGGQPQNLLKCPKRLYWLQMDLVVAAVWVGKQQHTTSWFKTLLDPTYKHVLVCSS